MSLSNDARLADIIRSVAEGIVSIDGQLRIVLFNPAAEQMFGRSGEEMSGQPLSALIPERFRAQHDERIRNFAATGQTNRAIGKYGLIYGLHANGEEFPIEATISQAGTPRNKLFTVILRDITSRIEAEKALRKNYELLDRIFATTHFCLVYLDRNFNFVRVNKAYADACGYPPEFFPGRNHFALYPGEKFEAIFRQVVATGKPFTIYGNPFEFPDHPEKGVTYWDWTLHPLRGEDGDVEGLLFALLDVTGRKRAEDALRSYAARLRELSRRLREVEESERRAISRELHDRIGQELTTLGLMIGALNARLSREARSAVEALLKDMQVLVQFTVAHVRDVMAELRPPVLDDYGLLAALRHLVTGFSKRTGIAVNLSGVEPYPRLPPVVETAMVRISQEVLNNIVKHAHAKNVEISLDPASGRVVLEIADDGVGFDTSNLPDSGKHWGMITMRERAEAVGITFRLESAPGAGTRIVLEAERAAS